MSRLYETPSYVIIFWFIGVELHRLNYRCIKLCWGRQMMRLLKYF